MLKYFIWSWVPYIINKGHQIIYTGYNLYKVVYNELFSVKEFIFLKTHSIPISSDHFGAIENTNVKWRCQVNPIRFVEPGFTGKEKHLPYLGFTVKNPGQADIDLSTWINDIKYIGQKQPSLQELLFLWCCQTGTSYFHCLDLIQIEIIDEMGDTVIKGLNEYTHNTL